MFRHRHPVARFRVAARDTPLCPHWLLVVSEWCLAGNDGMAVRKKMDCRVGSSHESC